MRIQPDGKIVLVGYAYFNDNGTVKSYFAVARYNTDGSLDTSFGGDGKVTTAFTGPSDVAFDIAVQADGKVLWRRDGPTI